MKYYDDDDDEPAAVVVVPPSDAGIPVVNDEIDALKSTMSDELFSKLRKKAKGVPTPTTLRRGRGLAYAK